MTLHAITVIGHDRPGIIAETTGALAGLGVNLTDSTMTLLRGNFSMMLVTSGEARTDEILTVLRPIQESGLAVSVLAIVEEPLAVVPASSWVVTVHGGDRLGIVSGVVAELAASGGNITDLTTRLSSELYLLVTEVDIPVAVDVEALGRRLTQAADRVGVTITMHPATPDDL